MKRSLFLITIFAASAASFAQDQLKVGDILDLEERIMVKKMTDELNKPNPNAPPAPPVVVVPRAPKIVYPTETLAVYGTSVTFYEGELSMGGRNYTVRAGTPVNEYVVTSVGPNGIELVKAAPAKKTRHGHRATAPQKVTLFAPMASH